MPNSFRNRSQNALWIACLLLVWLSGLGQGLPTANAQGSSLPEDVLKKVKHATVYLRVKLANGSDSQGTGWFIEPGIIVTNAHVLNIHGGDKRLPSKIEVVIDGGEATSQTVIAKYVGSDFDADLTLLKVDGDKTKLPQPLTPESTAELGETQEVFVFGYPFGKDLGKNITVNKSSISSLRKENGELKEIQVNGGIHPGNSGGPVVNQAGEVIGVAVGGLTSSTISFAVPSQRVSRLLNGKMLGIRMELPYLEAEQLKVPVRVTVQDPLKRIQKLQVEYWTNSQDYNKPRLASETRPEPVDGDGSVQTMDVAYDGNSVTTVDVPVSALTEEKSSYCFRATLIDGGGKAAWSAAVANVRPVPIDRREITLKFKPASGAGKPMQIVNDATFKYQVGTRTETFSMNVRVVTAPFLLPPDAEGDTIAKLRFSTVAMGARQNGEPVNTKELWTPLAQGFLKTSADIRYADDGTVINTQPDLRKVDPKLKKMMVAIGDQVLQSLELLSVPLPNRPLQPKDKIRTQKMMLVGMPGSFVAAQADVKYQYLGVRKAKDGRETAFFEMTADLRPRRGDDAKITGRLVGSLDVLLETGEVLNGGCGVNMDIELFEGNAPRLVGSLGMDFRPAPAAPTLPKTTGPADK